MQTVREILKSHKSGHKLSMVTAYDYTSASLLEAAGVDMILVGDSLANVVQGKSTTLPVTLEEIIYHSEMVVRGAPKTFTVADLPFMSYQSGFNKALESAGEVLKKSGANAVKLEGGREIYDSVRKLVSSGIPVMGHLGLLPQSVNISGYSLQANTEEAKDKLLQDAQLLEEAGAFSIVIEKIPADVSEELSKLVSIPLIGIGSGPACGGQVLVFHDLISLKNPENSRKLKFVKEYAQTGKIIVDAVREYIEDVKSGSFPTDKHSW